MDQNFTCLNHLLLSTLLFSARGKHMSLFICICRGEFDNLLDWPFSHRVSFTLIDQGLDPAARRNITYSVKPNICKVRGVGKGQHNKVTLFAKSSLILT